MNAAIADALSACEEILQGARQAQESSIADSTDDLNAFIDARLAAWGLQAASERRNAEWQEDSYYRYNLIRLLQAKQQAIDDAVAATKAAWAESMQGERSDGMDFRSDQRESFRQFTEETASALATAIADDASNMDAIVAEREASLDSRLDASQTALEDAMEADRAEMQRRLKEVYNYNSYEFDQSTPLSDYQSTPYSHEQHRAFMNRFAFYLRDQLANRDAQNAADNNQYNSSINDKTDGAVEQNEDLQRGIQDSFDAFTKSNERYADNLLEDFAEKQALALEMLQDFRDAEQAGATD
jgi:hypothetical protein